MTFRRDVEYPAGAGVEYEMTRRSFDSKRFEPLSLR